MAPLWKSPYKISQVHPNNMVVKLCNDHHTIKTNIKNIRPL